MASFNKVILMGNLTKDPDQLRTTPSGVSVLDLRLAVNRKFKGGDGELRDETCFVNVSAWGKEAESCSKYLAKGSQVAIDGRIQTRQWEDDRGARHWKTEVVAGQVEMLSGRRKKDYETQAQAVGAAASADPADPVPDEAVA